MVAGSGAFGVDPDVPEAQLCPEREGGADEDDPELGASAARGPKLWAMGLRRRWLGFPLVTWVTCATWLTWVALVTLGTLVTLVA